MNPLQRLRRRRSVDLPQAVSLDTGGNPVYERLSEKFGIAQVVLYLALLLFVALSFLRNTELITYENFYYFFKDLGAFADPLDTSGGDTVTYSPSDEQSFTVYRDGLAVAGNRSVSIFSEGGRQTVGETVTYSHPVAVGTGKYLLVYDLGGMRYSVYNSYARMRVGTTDYPILGAAVSESGAFAIVTSTERYAYAVLLYDNRFEPLAEYGFAKSVVCDAVLADDGGRIGILLSDTTEEGCTSRFLCYEVGRETPTFEAAVGDSLGISCAQTGNGTYAILCRDGLTFLSGRGKTEGTFSFGNDLLHAFCAGEDGVTLLLKKTAVSVANRLIVFDKSGKIVYNEETETTVRSLARAGDSVFWLDEDGIVRLNIRTGRIETRSASVVDRRLLAVNANEVFLCSPQMALRVRFD